MKRSIASMALGLALSSALTLGAQEPAKQEAAAPRFAFFSLGLAVDNSPKAKKMFSELEATQKALNDKLKAKSEEGQKMQQQLQGGSLSEQGREQLRKQLRDLEFEYKKLQEDSQTEFEKVRQRVLGDFYKVAGPIIEAIAKEQHLQVVMSGESAQAGQLIHWADETWFKAFTLEVAKRLEASNLTPSAKPATPVKPSPAPSTTKPPVKKP